MSVSQERWQKLILPITVCNYTMFRNGFPDASIKDKLTKHKIIINYSGLPKYCVVAVIKRFNMYKPIKLQGYKDAFTIKAKNRRFAVIKKEVDGKNRNMIYITSLTSETGKEDGAITKLSENEKIKYSLVGLSDEAIKELYACLHHYLKNVL